MHLVVVVVIYTVRVFMFAWFRPKVEWTGDTVKSAHLKTPSVIIANHTSMLDPIMMLAVFFYNHKVRDSLRPFQYGYRMGPACET